MTGIAMRKLAILGITATLALGASTISNAAGLGGKSVKDPVPIPEPIASAPASWAGTYFGGHLGGAVDGDEDFLGGAQLGYNWQEGNLVYGVEGDISFGDDTVGTIRGRLGLASPSWLLFGTVGLAIDDNDEGVVAGGGLEFKVADNTSIGVEALYYDLDDSFTVIRGRLNWHFGGGRY